MTLHDEADRAVETLLRLLNGWYSTIDRITDSIDELRATNYDAERSPVAWCEVHERDVPECRKADLLCRGVVVSSKDPTGEAAMGRALTDERAWRDSWRAVAHHSLILERLAGRYFVQDPRKLPKQSNDCELHRRHDKWVPSYTAKPSAIVVDGKAVTDRKVSVCRACYDFARTRSRLPTDREVAHHATYGKWPAERQTDRLMAGLRKGKL